MKIDLNKAREVPHDFAYELETYGYEEVQKYYCNKKEIGGYVIKNKETNELFFIEYYGLDSWVDGCLQEGQDELPVYKAEKVEFGDHILYNLSAEPRYVYINYYDNDDEDDIIEDDESNIF